MSTDLACTYWIISYLNICRKIWFFFCIKGCKMQYLFLYKCGLYMHEFPPHRNSLEWGIRHVSEVTDKDKDKDKDLFIGPQEFVVGYSKAPEQPQSSARPICHSHAMTRTGRITPRETTMAKWLEQASQWHEMYGHDLEVMNSNPGRVELQVHGTSVLSRTWIKIKKVNWHLGQSNERS